MDGGLASLGQGQPRLGSTLAAGMAAGRGHGDSRAPCAGKGNRAARRTCHARFGSLVQPLQALGAPPHAAGAVCRRRAVMAAVQAAVVGRPVGSKQRV